MVKILTPLALAALAGLSQATSLVLVTQSAVTNGKQGNIDNQFFIYDNNSLSPCTSSTQNAFCDVAPGGANAAYQSACNAKYSGSQSTWATGTGLFQNAKGQVFITGGNVGVTYKNGSSFGWDVTSNSHCTTFSCQLKSSDGSSTITSKGFKCTT